MNGNHDITRPVRIPLSALRAQHNLTSTAAFLISLGDNSIIGHYPTTSGRVRACRRMVLDHKNGRRIAAPFRHLLHSPLHLHRRDDIPVLSCCEDCECDHGGSERYRGGRS